MDQYVPVEKVLPDHDNLNSADSARYYVLGVKRLVQSHLPLPG
jgi:hypothetical protein